MSKPEIPGGFILIARKLFDSELMNKPPLYLKLWPWMLAKANWKDRDKLKRGQFVSSISEMQEAMSYYSGYRKITPTKDEIRSAYGAFVEAAMITTTKTTRGMVVTVCNYDIYQNPESYGPHTGPRNGDTAEPTVTPHDTKKGLKNKNIKKTSAELKNAFEQLWERYPRKEMREEAEKQFYASVKTIEDARRVWHALSNYLDQKEGVDLQYILQGKKWFKNWQDYERIAEGDNAA